MGGREIKWRHLAHYQLMSQLILVHTVQVKPNTTAQISGKLVSSGISDVAIATRLKKLIMIIIIMNNRKTIY